ncbi:MAG: CAP domain-containing protein [Actinomycetota bacterium]|nr:CAP domain-containing protein [Actinomycetota bacterium]
MRRNVLLLAAVGATGVALLFCAAASARLGAKLTATPPAVTTDTTATFKWKSSRATLRTLCRLRWQALPGAEGLGARAPARLARKFKRCNSPKTWSGLVPGRYAFALITVTRRTSARVTYRWKIVPHVAGVTPPPPPPPPGPPPPPPPPPGAASFATPPYRYLKPVHPEISSAEQQFVDLVNQARQSLALQPLSVNSKLSLAADSHSYWQDAIYGRSGLSHTGCGGTNPWPRLADAGYKGVVPG